jgi:Cu/Zn superoxide dismutase
MIFSSDTMCKYVNPLGLHGFHVHETGSTDQDCALTGLHFNPDNVNHGGPDSAVHHAGDLGNVFAASNGRAKGGVLVTMTTSKFQTLKMLKTFRQKV